MRSDEKDFRSAIAVEGTALSRIRPLAPPDDSRWNRIISRSSPEENSSRQQQQLI